ncbi:MAG: SPFH domain-containing protein [Chloroflexota bacterium]
MTPLFYRPTENHIGVVYRNERFHRFVDARNVSVLIPRMEYVAKEVRLDARTAVISLKNVFTSDAIPLDVELKIFYRVDIRKTAMDRRLQAVRFASESAWEEIIRTGITDIVRNDVFISQAFERLNTQQGRAYLKRTLSSQLENRVRPWGIALDRHYGVNIVNLQPNEVFQKAMRERSAAPSFGEAAVERLRPILSALGAEDSNTAMTQLLLLVASAISRTNEIPAELNVNEISEGFQRSGAVRVARPQNTPPRHSLPLGSD